MTDPSYDPAAVVRQQMQGWLQEAVALRKEVAASLPSAGSAPERFAHALLKARAAQDRVEEIQDSAVNLAHMAKRWKWEAEDAASDAFDSCSSEFRRTGRNGGSASWRERESDVNLRILSRLQAARAARKFCDEMEEMAERLRAVYWGLSGVREDLGNYLRYLQWEKMMER